MFRKLPLMFLMLSGLWLVLASSAAFAQTPDGEAYTVQADDWLSKIAEKAYGDPLAYEAIVAATNAKAAEDDSFTMIDNPDRIEVGQQLWLPAEVTREEADMADNEPVLAPQETITTPTEAVIAYVQGDTVYMRGGLDSEPVAVECPSDCTDANYLHLKWSPDGDQLTYYLWNFDGAVELHIANRDGSAQVLTDEAATMYPAAWSPDGEQLAYFQVGEDFESLNVFVAPAEGGDAEQVGSITPAGYGCGGAGTSLSQMAYESEGAFGRFGYSAQRMIWTPSDILLYSTDCTAVGVGRFDMAAGEQLDGYPDIHSLTVSPSGEQWAGLVLNRTDDSDNLYPMDELVIGSPTSTEYDSTGLEASTVQYGGLTGTLYYTTREITAEPIMFESEPLILDFAEATLWQWNDGNAELLLEGLGDYAYTRMSELPDGTLLFGVISNPTEVKEALDAALEENPDMDEFEQGSFIYEQSQEVSLRDIARLEPGSDSPTIWVENAGQIAVGYPQ